jgi:hypothetical protein
MAKIYVNCPDSGTSGGFELLHQLVYKLNEIEKNIAVIYYSNLPINGVHPTPEIYMKYTKGEYVSNIEDEYESVLILPEIFTNHINNYKNIRIVLWWMSVDNFFKSVEIINSRKKITYKDYIKGKKYFLYKLLNYINIKPKDKLFDPFEINILYNKNIILHTFQSEYARLFLEEKYLIPSLPLSDFLNSDFFNKEIDCQNRNSVILYNPKKGLQITKSLMTLMPKFIWIPIEDLTSVEMKDMMLKSKIYVDFGNHPGKDRIPREAAINGCVVITNKKGSAQNLIDIPIGDEYKFENPIEEIEDLMNLVNDVFLNFDIHFGKFELYRQKIKNEEEEFNKEILNFYNYIK